MWRRTGIRVKGGLFCLAGRSVVQVSFIVFKDALSTEQDGSAIVVTSTVKGKYVYFHYSISRFYFPHRGDKEKRRLAHIYRRPA